MQCVWVNNKGQVKIDYEYAPNEIEQCQYIVMETADIQAIQEIPTLQNMFATPEESAIQAAFLAGITIPVIVYLASWAYQSVINFVQRNW